MSKRANIATEFFDKLMLDVQCDELDAWDIYQEQRNATYGMTRRRELLRAFELGLVMPINGHHLCQSKADPDLKKLLKDGKVEMITDNARRCFKRTYLRKKHGT